MSTSTSSSRLDQLCNLLSKTQEDIQSHQQATTNLKESESKAQYLHGEIGRLQTAIVKQRKESQKLENSNAIENFLVYSLCNYYNGQGKTERREQLKKDNQVNQTKLSALRENLNNVKERITVLEPDAALLPSTQRSYDKLFAEKKALILESGDCPALGASCQKRTQLGHDIELLEATVAAGTPALDSLRRVKSHLSSAANWGVADMMGGGLLVTMGKRAALDSAKSAAMRAKNHMEQFSKALDHLGQELQHDMGDMSGFSAFADYFMDGILIDWFVQSQINKASDSCRVAIQKVTDILKETESRLASKQSEAAQCDEEQTALVLSFGQSQLQSHTVVTTGEGEEVNC